MTPKGVSPLHKNLEAIMNMNPTTSNTELCAFIELINYYQDMWVKRSHKLKPLNILMSKNVELEWSHVEQNLLTRLKNSGK